jgi:hypothetical protein
MTAVPWNLPESQFTQLGLSRRWNRVKGMIVVQKTAAGDVSKNQV